MHVAGAKAVRDSAVGLVQDDRLLLHRPITGKRPVIEAQPLRDRVYMARSTRRDAAPREIRRALVAEVRLRRAQVGPVRGGLDAARVNDSEPAYGRAMPRLGEQFLDRRFDALVLALAEMPIAHAPLHVDEIQSRPSVVLERAPNRVFVVDRDGILDTHRLHRATDVLGVLLELELRRVHADYDEPLVAILLCPSANIRCGAQPVDAGVGPEVDEHDLP